jgi:hypothetical protein
MQSCASGATDRFQMKPINQGKFCFENSALPFRPGRTAGIGRSRAQLGGEPSQ